MRLDNNYAPANPPQIYSTGPPQHRPPHRSLQINDPPRHHRLPRLHHLSSLAPRPLLRDPPTASPPARPPLHHRPPQKPRKVAFRTPIKMAALRITPQNQNYHQGTLHPN